MGEFVNLLMALRRARPLFANKFKCPMILSDRKGEAAFLFKAINLPAYTLSDKCDSKSFRVIEIPKEKFLTFLISVFGEQRNRVMRCA